MAGLVIADTDVLVDFFAGIPLSAQHVMDFLKEGRLAVTTITVFELYAGVRGPKRLRQIEAFCETMPVFPLDLLAAAYAGRIFTELKSQGVTIGNQDILIAGICLANSLPLLTANRARFARIKGLELF